MKALPHSLSILLFFLGSLSVACNGTTPQTLTPSPAASVTESGPSPEATAAEETIAVPFTTIIQDAPLGDEPAEPTYAVITAPGGWERIEGQLPPEAVAAGREGNQEQLFFIAFGGARASSGYQMTISSLRSSGDQLLVTVDEQRPDADDIVEPAMTLPFHVVAVPTHELPEGVASVIFQRSNGEIIHEQPFP